MGLQERARLDGRVAKWCTIQLLDAASRSAARAASADRIAAAWLRRRAIAAADCGAHDTNYMCHIDDTNKNLSVSGLRRPRDRTSTGLGCCWCALSSAKHLGGAGDACVRDVMVLVVVVQLVLLVCGLVGRNDTYK